VSSGGGDRIQDPPDGDERARQLFQGAPYRAIVEDMTELVVRWTPDGTRLFVNDAYCRLFRASREEVIGTSFWGLIDDKDRAQVQARIDALSPREPVSTGRHRALTPGGEVVWMEWTDRAVYGEGGKLVELQSVGRDITERVNLEQAARQVERADAVARTSAAVAHDINNLLMVMDHGMHEVRRALPGNESAATVAKAMEETRELMRQLAELRYGRVLRPVVLDLNERVRHDRELLVDVCQEAARLELDLTSEACLVSGDPTQVGQVLMNLVSNAATAMSERGTIRIATQLVHELDPSHVGAGAGRGRFALLHVEDDAGGIAPSVLPRIFEPHVSTKPGGRGLGLATVKAIVEAHSASIAVFTTNQGSRFEIAFPATAP